MEWLDRPIRSGDPFVPRGPCLVRSHLTAWMFEPEGDGGGRWTRLPLKARPSAGNGAGRGFDPSWRRYGWITWHEDGSDYRLRIGTTGPRGRLTDKIEAIEGEF